MKIQDFLNKLSISINLHCENKTEILNKMIDLAYRSGKITNIATATQDVFKREQIMSTGVGKGIALPHAKTHAVSDIIGALAILDSPVDFDSLDSEPVEIVFLLLGRETNVGIHLRILSKISRLMNSDAFRSELKECKSSDEVLVLFNKYEEEYFN
jgi:fructose-specific phosphotransferase system IIA component